MLVLLPAAALSPGSAAPLVSDIDGDSDDDNDDGFSVRLRMLRASVRHFSLPLNEWACFLAPSCCSYTREIGSNSDDIVLAQVWVARAFACAFACAFVHSHFRRLALYTGSASPQGITSKNNRGRERLHCVVLVHTAILYKVVVHLATDINHREPGV